jgi:DNA-binding MarR family transcriptional regulator
VARAETAPAGRVLPTTITPLGRRRLAEASALVRGVERRMLAGLDARDEAETRRLLRSLVHAIRGDG